MSTENVNVVNVEWDFFCDFQTAWHCVLFLSGSIFVGWQTHWLAQFFFVCIQGRGKVTYPLFEKYPCGKILGQSLVLPREYQNRLSRKKVSFWSLKGKKAPLEVEESSGNTIRSCHYQTHSFAMNL